MINESLIQQLEYIHVHARNVLVNLNAAKTSLAFNRPNDGVLDRELKEIQQSIVEMGKKAEQLMKDYQLKKDVECPSSNKLRSNARALTPGMSESMMEEWVKAFDGKESPTLERQFKPFESSEN